MTLPDVLAQVHHLKISDEDATRIFKECDSEGAGEIELETFISRFEFKPPFLLCSLFFSAAYFISPLMSSPSSFRKVQVGARSQRGSGWEPRPRAEQSPRTKQWPRRPHDPG